MQINAKLKSPDIFLAKLIASRQRGLEGSGGGIKNCQVHHAPWLPHGCHMVVTMLSWLHSTSSDLWTYGNYRIGSERLIASSPELSIQQLLLFQGTPGPQAMSCAASSMEWLGMQHNLIALDSQMFPDLESNKCWERVHDKVRLIHDIHISSTRSYSLQL